MNGQTNAYVRKVSEVHPYELQLQAKKRLQERAAMQELVARADAKAHMIYNAEQRGKMLMQEVLSYA